MASVENNNACSCINIVSKLTMVSSMVLNFLLLFKNIVRNVLGDIVSLPCTCMIHYQANFIRKLYCYKTYPINIKDALTLNESLNRNDQQPCKSDHVPVGNSFNFEKSGLHIAHLNICHLMPKLDEIKSHLNNTPSPDILGITETFLNDKTRDNELHISKFKCERLDRKLNKRGGGIVVYIAEKVPYQRRIDVESDDIESVWIEILFPHTKSFLINFTYRPPSANQSWIEKYESQLENVDNMKLEYHILGDLNINYFPDNKRNPYSITRWKDVILKYGLKQSIKWPTRVTKHGSTIIDHIYSSSTSFINEIFVSDLSISDHYPICFSRSTKNLKSHTGHKIITYRSFKKFREENFQRDLMLSNLNCIEAIANPNTALNVFYNILNNVLSKHAPIKRKRIKYKTQPEWFNNDIRTLILERDICHKNGSFDRYKQLRNKVSLAIKKAKKGFFNKAVKDKKDSKVLWKTVKDASNSNNDGIILPNLIMKDKQLIRGDSNIANELNDHFISISNIVQKTQLNVKNFIEFESVLNSKLKYHTFDIDYIMPHEVKKIIDTLDTSKSTGLDGIGPKIIKQCGDFIVPAITSLINKSIDCATFPDLLKEARVVPIFKSGDKNDPHNYRPISILPTISKIFERHIASQLQAFFTKHNVIHDGQSGFRKNHSCHTALIRLVDSWLKDIDSGKYIGSVFLDLRKAFDLVDHQILLHKLKLYHFSEKTINLFKSYLTNRKQLVKIDNTESQMKTILSGVPQGSILGPLLFIIYINDIAFTCGDSNIDLYADDTTLHESGYNINEIQMKLQITLNKIIKWCDINNMVIHPEKSKCMVIGTVPRVKAVKEFHLNINGTLIENVTVQKVLGVYVDNTLTWNVQVDEVCKKLNSKIRLLKRISYYLSADMKRLFYNGYILPIIDYCCTVWGKRNNSNINKIIKLQRRSAKVICKTTSKSLNKESLNELKWLTFPKRCEYHTSVLVYKIFHKLAPLYMNNLINVSNNSTHNLRSNTSKHITVNCRIKTNYMKDSFTYYSMTIWNKIPGHIREAKNLVLFKKLCKDYLLSTNEYDL